MSSGGSGSRGRGRGVDLLLQAEINFHIRGRFGGLSGSSKSSQGNGGCLGVSEHGYADALNVALGWSQLRSAASEKGYEPCGFCDLKQPVVAELSIPTVIPFFKINHVNLLPIEHQLQFRRR